jgi:hypothetical protein
MEELVQTFTHGSSLYRYHLQTIRELTMGFMNVNIHRHAYSLPAHSNASPLSPIHLLFYLSSFTSPLLPPLFYPLIRVGL